MTETALIFQSVLSSEIRGNVPDFSFGLNVGLPDVPQLVP